MAKKHSTGALSDEQKKAQDDLYAQGHEYDYVIIGTGNSALTVGSLLANAGHKVCMLEAHDIPGGYAQNFKWGDFVFNAQVHYIWGCGPGGKVYEFLKRIGLEKDITFELFDADGYDHMAMPDGKVVKVPYGFDKLVDNIDEAYPGQRDGVQKFVDILSRLYHEMSLMPDVDKVHWWHYVIYGWRLRTLIKYRKATLQDLFDECGLSKEAQAVLCANAGDFMLPPNRLSLIMYAALFCGYNTGTYYPTKHFKYYIERLAQFITEHEGCHIYYESKVTKIDVGEEGVTNVETEDGKVFKAKRYICNADPQTMSKVIGQDKFPADYLPKLQYEYSQSGVVIYLGLKDIDLKKHGLGSFNIWHLEDWDMNEMWKKMEAGDFEKPWIFISTATLHTDQPGVAPEDQQIMEIAMYTDYQSFKDLQDKDYKAYAARKKEVADIMIDLVEKRYVPDLRKHIVSIAIGSSVTNEDFNLAPVGNAYGSAMTPENVNLDRLTEKTPWKNFFWCNASSGGSGVYGTVSTGASLYMKLTGDRYYDPTKVPTPDEMIATVHERLKAERQ